MTGPLAAHSTSLGQRSSLKTELKVMVRSVSVIVADWLGARVNSESIVAIMEGNGLALWQAATMLARIRNEVTSLVFKLSLGKDYSTAESRFSIFDFSCPFSLTPYSAHVIIAAVGYQ